MRPELDHYYKSTYNLLSLIYKDGIRIRVLFPKNYDKKHVVAGLFQYYVDTSFLVDRVRKNEYTNAVCVQWNNSYEFTDELIYATSRLDPHYLNRIFDFANYINNFPYNYRYCEINRPINYY